MLRNLENLSYQLELQRIKHYLTLPSLGKTFVAIEATTKNVVGYICLEFRWRSLVIQSLVTHHEHLRKGIGKKLVEKAIAILVNSIPLSMLLGLTLVIL